MVATQFNEMLVTINAGSSSLRTTICDAGSGAIRYALHADSLGSENARLRTARVGEAAVEEAYPGLTAAAALERLFNALHTMGWAHQVVAIGHRVVHGGPDYREHQPVTPDMIAALRHLTGLDQDHMPTVLEGIGIAMERCPHAAQVACFDTTFHASMPRVAQLYAIPAHLTARGIRRYGFHGLSYESIVEQLAAQTALTRRMVIAHLGSGASMVAIADGRPVETTMGFTPSGGLVMATRPGDLDPGIAPYLLAAGVADANALTDLINHRCGLLALSGSSGDMRELLARESVDSRAADAVGMFVYQACKQLGGLVAVLGGLDALVFTGGIGEKAAAVRGRICDQLRYLGIELDPARNLTGEGLISAPGARVSVRVIESRENDIIAAHTARVLEKVRVAASRIGRTVPSSQSPGGGGAPAS